jgi:hypothetical protein
MLLHDSLHHVGDDSSGCNSSTFSGVDDEVVKVYEDTDNLMLSPLPMRKPLFTDAEADDRTVLAAVRSPFAMQRCGCTCTEM